MGRRNVYLCTAMVALLLWSNALSVRADQVFDTWMQAFEQAKQKGDYPACEANLLQALDHGATEYAVGSLVWAQMLQNKTEIALANAQRMVTMYGRTPYAVGSLLDASMREGDFDIMTQAADTAKRLNLANGSDWRNRMVKDLLVKVHDLTTPAVYKLRWTIPGKEFTLQRSARRFGFPLLKTSKQSFTYRLDGAASSLTVEASETRAIVEITGKPGQDIVVTGTAAITPEIVGARTLRKIANVPLTSASSQEVGVFYYWTEAFDPKISSIAPIAREVHRSSAAETMQAILNWRDRNMPYRTIAPGPGSTLDKIVAQGCGVCHHASYMTASLARANGIPAVVIGVDCLPASGSFTDADTSHGHISVKLPTIGWTSVEPLDRTSLLTFGRSNYLRFAIQEQKEEDNRISLQNYKVSGERVQ